MLPNFIIIGAMKAGTSSLHASLASHPDIFMCSPKEPNYFVESRNWGKGIAWYESLFRDARSATAIGEASTSYSMYPNVPGVPERIASVIPKAKLIYAVRDPIDRIRSQYEHRVRHGYETRPMAQALLEDSSYVDFSRYAFQLEQYLEFFPREQILIFASESFRQDRTKTVGRVLEFLGVRPFPEAPYLLREQHVTRRPRFLDRWVRRVPGGVWLAHNAPPSLKSLYSKVAMKGPPRISPRVQKELELRLVEDLAEFQRLVGVAKDWGWALQFRSKDMSDRSKNL